MQRPQDNLTLVARDRVISVFILWELFSYSDAAR